MNKANETWLTSQEFIWCAGCPMTWLTMSLAKQFQQWNLDKNDTWLVSGIGCTGRIASYFACNTAHTTHGRAVPVAEGIKLAQPNSNVFIVSGDGDLLSIGLSHLIHAARRNISLKIICVNNSLYAMTGGQSSPTTQPNVKTKTYPLGSPYPILPTSKLLKDFEHVYYRRLTVFDVDGLAEALDSLYHHQGFGFVEIVSVCLTNDPRLKRVKNKQEIINKILEGGK
jgi:2-oxoglutarate ferredoxin oxidoreductase subunit beta